jgi:hypothetical protein
MFTVSMSCGCANQATPYPCAFPRISKFKKKGATRFLGNDLGPDMGCLPWGTWKMCRSESGMMDESLVIDQLAQQKASNELINDS